jgi:2-dehydro-3-deoxygalactonokinase
MPPPSQPPPGVLIAADWGTTRFRALLLSAGGEAIAEIESGDGINALSGGHEAAFERLVGGWPKVPAIIAGMAGSRQGWREAPYVSPPATVEAIADHVIRFEAASGRPVAIVPGVMLRSAERDGDVMRGEETQVIGLLRAEPEFDGVVILPGTHSKWVRVAGGAIADFQTYLTGELFDLLARHSFLRHSVGGDGGDIAGRADFAIAVKRTAKAGLPFLAAIFSVRARALLGKVQGEDNLAYLSGLLIGGEIAAAQAAGWLPEGAVLRIVGSRSLANAYKRAFEIVGFDCAVRDGGELAKAGLMELARAIDLVPEADQ